MVSKGVNPSLVALACDTNLDLQLKVGMCESIVSRSYMEDRSYTCVREDGLQSPSYTPYSPTYPPPYSSTDSLALGLSPLSPLSPSSANSQSTEEPLSPMPLALCAVFDGHNGSYAAELLRFKFAPTFTALLREAESRGDLSVLRVAGLFDETCMQLDCDILRSDYRRQDAHKVKGGAECVGIKEQVETFAGSAGVMLAMVPILRRRRNSISPSNYSHRSTRGGISMGERGVIRGKREVRGILGSG
ncbi:hypothetical protein B484DRAFT_177268 [Ochromonadaceae sp. CCMP2298]|nr:hypothetical protein B484DRAFT_177268 [Ochromonadaceae sp. CCMP2298]